ncbi:SIMPL domain-containing protein [Leucobacter luti]|uniref:SIMPL domain-containing protein n=1 Tax=Leucobacter luti TaxID=340320 RepID=UPI001C68B403|nr:SIMPL domain-containing protein [Leucobacter luti]QYM75981.1 SIMPL domain-containing protein [Leucobacter luti]
MTEIVVTGSSERRVPADRAQLQLSASNAGPERQRVVAGAGAVHERIVARAQELVASGVAESYTAEAVSTYTNSWRDEHGEQIVEHRASVSVGIELLALDEVGALTTEFAEAGIDPQVSWQLSAPARTAMLRDLRAEAVADAHTAAADYALAIGKSALELRELRDGSTGRGPVPIGAPRFAMMADAGAPPEVTVHDILVSVDVEARFGA